MELSIPAPLWILLLAAVFIAGAAAKPGDSLRTGYHFQPRRNWINDPNGPMYYNGVYHLFYQYNPNGAVWGNIRWAHSVSRDLINWRRLPIAIQPSKPFDQYGCWSGSATILPGNKPVILYTGIVDQNQTQVQNYAVPANLSDVFLARWTKPDNNPLIVPLGTINKTAFRDPTTGWKGKDGEWRVSLGGRNGSTGIVYLYKSKDFINWVEEPPLHTVPGTGNFECPDFYPVLVNGKNGLDTSAQGPSIKHVLKVSLDATRYEYYTIGTYLPENGDTFTPDKGMVDGWNGLRYDYGNFYASKTFYDAKTRRRILWGWANESDSTADDVKKGWAGIQLIPRTVVLDPNGRQLLLWPVTEVESLRGATVTLQNQTLRTGDKVEIKGITPAQADVEVTFSFPSLNASEPFNTNWSRYDAQKVCSQKNSSVLGGLGPFGIITLASKHMEEYTPVFFRIFRDGNKHIVLMCSDASRSSLKKEDGAYRPSFAGFVDVDLIDNKISLRSLIDNSVVESFGAGGKTCISSRVYPTLAIYGDAHLYAFNNGTEDITIETLEAWSMQKPRRMN